VFVDPITLGAGASFIAGAAGYVIAKYWIGPIRSFGRAKTALLEELNQLGELCPHEGKVDLKTKPIRRQMKRVRQKANALLECYEIDLPVWYRLKLRSAGRDPGDAVHPLLGLHQLPTAGQVNDRLDKANRLLQL
jgi:hypothetical protein